jgi:hypothetical protein
LFFRLLAILAAPFPPTTLSNSPRRAASLNFNDFPVYGSQLYSSPTLSGIGIVDKTIGRPR